MIGATGILGAVGIGILATMYWRHANDLAGIARHERDTIILRIIAIMMVAVAIAVFITALNLM